MRKDYESQAYAWATSREVWFSTEALFVPDATGAGIQSTKRNRIMRPRLYILFGISLAVLYARGVHAGGVVFTGSGDVTPCVGNTTNVLTASANGFQLSGGSPDVVSIILSVTDFGPASIASELGSADFELGFDFDPTSAPLPPTMDGNDYTSYGLVITLDAGADFIGLGWIDHDGSGNQPFLFRAATSTLVAGPDATGKPMRLIMTRVGDHVDLTDSRFGLIEGFDLDPGAAITGIGVYSGTGGGPIPAGGGKFSRFTISSPAITTNINAYAEPTPTPIPTPLPTPEPEATPVPGQTGPWTQLPLNGGNVFNGIVIEPDNPSHLFAVVGAGKRYVIESNDGGDHWIEKTAHFYMPSNIADPVFLNFLRYVDTATTDTIYAGRFRSLDGGQSFEDVPNLIDTSLWVSEVDPSDSQVLYASRGSDQVTTRTLIYKSTDGGGTWNELVPGLTLGNAFAPNILVDPADSNLVLASIYPIDVALTDSGGVYRSTDGGINFTRVLGTASNTHHIRALVRHPAAPGVYFASTNQGLYRSIDSGETWEQITFSGDWQGIVPHPTDASIVYAYGQSSSSIALAANGFFTNVLKSTDGGQSFVKVSSEPVAFPQFAWCGAVDVSGATDTLYAGGASMGVFKSTDGGSTWSERNNGISDNSVTFITEAGDDISRLLVSTSRGLAELHVSSEGITLQNSSLLKVIIGQIAFDRFNPNYAIAKADNNSLVRTTDGGATWELPRGFGRYVGASREAYPTLTVYASRSTTGRFLVGTRGGVFKTTDYGVTYAQTPVLPHSVNRIDSGFVTGVGEVLYALVNGLGEGAIYKSIDDGESWTPVVIQPDGEGFDMAVDPSDGNRLYVMGIFHPGGELFFYRTTDGGLNFDDIKDPFGLPGGIRDIELDPNDALNIFTSTLGEILNSTDGGDTWTIFDQGFENVIGLYVAPAPGARPAFGRFQPVAATNSAADRLFAGRNGTLFTRYQPTGILRVRSWESYR